MQHPHPPSTAPCGVALLPHGRAPCAPHADVSTKRRHTACGSGSK